MPNRTILKALILLLALALGTHAATINFHTPRFGFVSLNIYGPDGKLARQFYTGHPFAAGDHEAEWDGKVDGKPLPAGQYTWRAIFRGDLVLASRGRIGDFGGDRGSPSAAAADGSRVYLGWSLASADGDAVAACDPSGAVLWTNRREPLSGCRALAVDAGLVYVLGGEGADAEGRAIYRLNAKDGSPAPWPDGRTDLKIVSLWPTKGNYKPDLADYLAVKNGRIYLSFSTGKFVSILDAKTGAYLQTIVGSPPGALDAVATKSDDPDKPGNLINADFVAMALQGAAIGKMLLAHDPIWVLASDLTPLDGVDRITALTAIGDGAKYHAHDIFVGLCPPANQVQGRSALETETVSYEAGKPGGRPPRGPWQPDMLGNIRGLALDATGQLWIAEGDSTPRRISVWTTDDVNGRLAHEFFAPPEPGSPVAVDPLDPALVYAGGCEWRLDPKEQTAACLCVITRDPVRAARYAPVKGHLCLVLTTLAGAQEVFERMADGDYLKSTRPAPAPAPSSYQLLPTPDGSMRLTTTGGFDLGVLFEPITGTSRSMKPPIASGSTSPFYGPPSEATLSEAVDGKVFVAARFRRIYVFQLTGLDTIRPAGNGTITLP